MPVDTGKTDARNSLATDVRECSRPHVVNALAWHRVRESGRSLYVAGQRIKIFLALFPLRSILTRRPAPKVLPLDRRTRKDFTRRIAIGQEPDTQRR